MLLIYDNLVKRLEEHLRNRHINATIHANIGKNWHKYRFIQVHPINLVGEVHYEYINSHWEIHFEPSTEHVKVESTRMRMVKKIETTERLAWHRRNNHQRGMLSINEEVENSTFESIFDELWDKTIDVLMDTSILNINEEKSTEIALSAESTTRQYELVLNNKDYYEPDLSIESVEQLPFDRFLVPPYQRPYKWNIKNVNQLINDIFTFCSRNSQEYRLGTLVIYKIKDNATTSLNIVDGQQRTITLVLLLNELRKEDRFKDLFPLDLCSGIEAFLSKKQFHESTSKNHIIENTKAIKFRLSEFSEESVEFLLKKCKLVLVSLYDISEAFQFFDSQNARGKELEPHDLLKAFHLREISIMTDIDRYNIEHWEKIDTDNLASLFLVLFRIKRWIDSKNGRFFTSAKVKTFKGPQNQKKVLPFQKIYQMAKLFTEIYNSDVSRRMDCQHLDFPHQIDQVTINGSLFFDMISYYANKIGEAKILLQKYNKDIYDTLDKYPGRERTGDKYIRTLFNAALLFYIDKFGEEGFTRAVPKIFAWCYSIRLKQEVVKLATMDNWARGNGSFFRMLHCANFPSDVLDWNVPPISELDIKRNDMEMIIKLLLKYKYIE